MTAVSAPITELPDTLVLGAGGTLGEAWMRGLLSGAGLDFRDCEYILGTSAGSIVAPPLVRFLPRRGRRTHCLGNGGAGARSRGRRSRGPRVVGAGGRRAAPAAL